MKRKKNHVLLLLTSGFLFFVDQYLKQYARTHQEHHSYIIDPWLGWEYFANPGVAFSIPVPNALLIFATPLILIAIVVYVGKKNVITAHQLFGVFLIFFGAVSNLIDRILFEATIDYLRIITAVINIADIMILAGALLLLFRNKTVLKLDKKAPS